MATAEASLGASRHQIDHIEHGSEHETERRAATMAGAGTTAQLAAVAEPLAAPAAAAADAEHSAAPPAADADAAARAALRARFAEEDRRVQGQMAQARA